jgi:cytochrome c-type biogenesis protein CcmH/NrfF
MMRNFSYMFVLIIINLFGFCHFSAQAIEYTSDELHQLGFEIASELRCPIAINQNLLDSQSPIANELKGHIFQMLEQGQSKQTIIDFMVVRYGEKIRYQPSLNAGTAALWFLPFILLIAASIATLFMVKHSNQGQRPTKDSAASQPSSDISKSSSSNSDLS